MVAQQHNGHDNRHEAQVVLPDHLQELCFLVR
jgi:hypothetical protein